MYYINIILLVIYACVLLWVRPTQGKKKIFCVLGATNWILLSGLRHVSIGPDTKVYQYAFYNSKYDSWSTLFENFRNTIFNWNIITDYSMQTSEETGEGVFSLLLGENALAVKDPGYAILCKAFYTIFPNYTAFLIFIAIVFTVPLAILIYRHSSEPLMSFLIYSCLFYSFFAITGHRQTLATGIALMSYLAFAEKKKFLPFLATILLAYPLHKSVLCFIPIYFLQYIKMDRKKIVAVLIIFPIVFILRGPITSLLANIGGYEGYDRQYAGAGAYTFTLVYLVLMVASLWKGKDAIEIHPEINTMLATIAFAFLLTPTTFIDPSLMRLVQYYSIFLVVYIPSLIMAFDDRETLFAYVLALFVLIGLFAKNNPHYLFFWQ